MVTEQQVLRDFTGQFRIHLPPDPGDHQVENGRRPGAGDPVTAAYIELSFRADILPFEPPGQLATARTLANYFGSPMVDVLDRLQPGQAAELATFGHGVLLLYLNRRVDGASPSLQSIHDLVRADALRDKQEAALENLLASLRKSARIDVAAEPTAESRN